MIRADDAIITLRDLELHGHQVTVTAEHSEPLRFWSVVSRIDSMLYDTRMSDNPEEDGTADNMLDEIRADLSGNPPRLGLFS